PGFRPLRRIAPLRPRRLHGPRGARDRGALRRSVPRVGVVGGHEGLLVDEGAPESTHRRAAIAFGVGGTHRVACSGRSHAVRPSWHREDVLRPCYCVTALLGLRRTAPSLLGHGTEAAASLRGALSDLGHVDRLVCFIDEADEIASARDARPESQPIVNELLKAIPIFKSRPGRLMVMATNSIAAIDPALLRPGRFDLIIPVGAPDREGRKELAGEFLGSCDPDDMAERTEGFT